MDVRVVTVTTSSTSPPAVDCDDSRFMELRFDAISYST
jgi:hypothetical protein